MKNMKKRITILVIVLIGFTVSAQKSKAKEYTQCYISNAVEVFSLSEDKSEQLTTLYTEKMEKRSAIVKKRKSGEITKEETKKLAKSLNKKYIAAFSKLAGKSKEEITKFEKETSAQCKQK